MIKTTRNVKWLSGPSGRPAIPKGNWIVVAIGRKNEILIAKDETMVQIPVSDVEKIADYSVERVIESIKKINPKTIKLGEDHGKGKEEEREGRGRAGDKGPSQGDAVGIRE